MIYSQNEINKAIGEYCAKRGRPTFSMDFNREARVIINSGKFDGIYSDIADFLDSELPIRKRLTKVLALSSVSDDAKDTMSDIIEHLIMFGKASSKQLIEAQENKDAVLLALFSLKDAGLIVSYNGYYRIAR